jgi:3-hydroxy-9,10-secoandrosta-1,3,5(10)-triene-9,17-dione monooxygenase
MTATRSKPRARNIPQPISKLTPEAMLQSAIDMQPLLRERQAETEAAGRVLDEVVDLCVANGFYRMLQPRRFGGYEFDLPSFARIAIELSRGCPSTGWAVIFTAGHTHILAKYPELTQMDVYGKDGDFRGPMVGGQNATARKIEGGYLINGSWDYASGIDAATHFFATCPVRDTLDEEPKGVVLPLFDRDQYEVEHNWQMFGMQGSGSHRVHIKEQFVPQSRVQEHNLLVPSVSAPEDRIFDNPMYAGPSTNILMAEIAAVAIGTGYAALDCYEEILRRRTAPRALHIRAEDREYQVYFGRALSWLETAKAALLGCTQQYMDYCRDEVAGTNPFTPEMSQRIVLVEQQACRLAGDAVDLMFRYSGSSQIKPGMPMQRYLRDIMTLLTHATMAFDRNAEQVAKLHFGLDVPAPAPGSQAFTARS